MPEIHPDTRAGIIKAWETIPHLGHRRTLSSIAKEFGITSTTVKMIVDPEYRGRRMARINELRRGAYKKP